MAWSYARLGHQATVEPKEIGLSCGEIPSHPVGMGIDRRMNAALDRQNSVLGGDGRPTHRLEGIQKLGEIRRIGWGTGEPVNTQSLDIPDEGRRKAEQPPRRSNVIHEVGYGPNCSFAPKYDSTKRRRDLAISNPLWVKILGVGMWNPYGTS